MFLSTLLCAVILTGFHPDGVSVRGVVIDAVSGDSLSRATVAILRRSDSTVVGGMYSDSTGRWHVDRFFAQDHILRISYVGYLPGFVDIVEPPSDTFDVGSIALRPVSIDEITVVAQRDVVRIVGPTKVFNVDALATVVGGTAVDVLRNVPTVNVDADGNITVRGNASVNIMIDGKPIRMFGDANTVLRSIPAMALDRVEVTTNPGAKYEAEGQNGILNIITKKRTDDGVNGSLTSSLGTLDLYTTALSGNVREGSVNVFFGLDASSSRHLRAKHIDATFIDGTLMTRTGPSLSRHQSWGIRGGVDVELSQGHTLTASGEWRSGDSRFSDPFFTSTQIREQAPIGFVDMQQHGGNPYSAAGIALSWLYTLSSPQHKLSADLNISPSTFDASNQNVFVPTDASATPLGDPTSGILTRLVGRSLSILSQFDYAWPVSEQLSLEAGLRSNFQGIQSDFLVDRLVAGGTFQRDAVSTTGARHQDDVHAAYVSATYRIEPLSIQIGLRGEHTMNFYESTTDSSLGFERAFGNLFPSASIGYSFDERSTLLLTYGRRINRPHATALNPFLDKTDSLNWRTGNPSLLPEYVDALELGYSHGLDGFSVTGETFFRRTSNAINLRFRETIAPGIVLEKPYNFGEGIAYGLSGFIMGEVVQGVRLNSEISYYRQQVEGIFRDRQWSSTGWGWNARIGVAGRLPLDVDAQLTFDYTAPQVIPQGRRMEFALVNLSLNRAFLQDRLTVGVNWTDMFNTARFGGWVTGEGFDMYLLNQRDYTLFSFNVTYRINNTERRRRGQGGAVSPLGGGGGGV